MVRVYAPWWGPLCPPSLHGVSPYALFFLYKQSRAWKGECAIAWNVGKCDIYEYLNCFWKNRYCCAWKMDALMAPWGWSQCPFCLLLCRVILSRHHPLSFHLASLVRQLKFAPRITWLMQRRKARLASHTRGSYILLLWKEALLMQHGCTEVDKPRHLIQSIPRLVCLQITCIVDLIIKHCFFLNFFNYVAAVCFIW